MKQRVLLVLVLFSFICHGYCTSCFAGAYYRKAMSDTDTWEKIEAQLLLPPDLHFDTSRTTSTGRYADNPSIYMQVSCLFLPLRPKGEELLMKKLMQV